MRTYGTARLAHGNWFLDVEPHVALRLKRFFGRLAKSRVGTLVLKSTDEVARDLEWFMARFPLVVEGRDELDRRAARHRDDADTFERLISGAVQPSTFDLAIEPRGYQRVAADLLLRAHGLLLADDVGTGKTCSAICALSEARARPALVVTLTHLPRQWEREIKRFCPKLRVHVVKKGTPYDVRSGAKRGRSKQPALIEPEFPDVLVINYHKLAGWSASLEGVIKTIVFDEIQELRKSDSQKSEAARSLAATCDYRLGLSATPIYNYGAEFFNVLTVLRPDSLGTREEFLTEWCKGDDDKASVKDPKGFGAYLRESGLMLRRTRADVGRELPPVSRIEEYVDADADALKEAEGAAAELARIILSRESSWEERGQAHREIDWRLRQATGIAKAPYVAAFVRMLVESGESVVLYGWHRAVYDVWNELLANLGTAMFTGSESPTQKEKAREAFLSGEAKVLIMSLRAGAGLDGLQEACRTVVFGELDWSPGVHEQAIGRIARDGQKDPVMAYFLVSDEGSDPFVSEVVGIKRAQIEGVRDPSAEIVTALSADAAAGVKRLAEHYLNKQQNADVAA